MGLIVRYHNDFNRIRLPDFKEQEMDLLFLILARIKNSKSGEPVVLTKEDLFFDFGDTTLSRTRFEELLHSLRTKFFKASFTIIEPTSDTMAHLFIEMKINYEDTKKNDAKSIFVIVNPRFEYLVKDFLGNFTRFELEEFKSVRGKYTKSLYRLLKQYRHTGYMRMDWEEFKDVMDIADYKRLADINERVLKPSIAELSKEIKIDGIVRIPFKNLKHKKIKDKFRKTKITGIEFAFDPQPVETDEQIANKATEMPSNSIFEPNQYQHSTPTPKSLFESDYSPKESKTQKPSEETQTKREIPEALRKLGVGSYKTINARYVGQTFMRDNGDVVRVFDLKELSDGSLDVTFKNADTRKTFKNTFQTETHLKSYLGRLIDLSLM